MAEPDRDRDLYSDGGDSLVALELARAVSSRIGVKVSLATVLSNPTIAELGVAVSQSRHRGAGPLDEVSAGSGTRPTRGPVSCNQEFRLRRDRWLRATGVTLGSRNVAWAHRVTGPFDPDLFAEAATEVVRRHDVFRTSFHDDGASFEQRIRPFDGLTLIQREPAGDSPERRLAAGQRELSQLCEEPFDYTRDLLLRAAVWRLGPTDHLVSVAVEHLICDAVAMRLLIDELVARYRAHVAGAPLPVVQPAVQFADYARWERRWLRSPEAERALEYWTERLSGASAGHTRFPPTVRLTGETEPDPTPTGAVSFAQLDDAAVRRLVARVRATSSTLDTVILAAFVHVLGGYAAQPALPLLTHVANRDRAGTEEMIGWLSNRLPFVLPVGTASFEEALTAVRNTAVAALTWESLPALVLGDTIASQDPDTPLPDDPVLSYVSTLAVDESWSDIEFGPRTRGRYQLIAWATAQRGFLITVERAHGGISIRITYERSRYPEALVRAILTEVVAILAA